MKLDGIRKTLHQVDKIRYRPALIGKIARGYFRTLVLRRPTVRIVEFSINTACQSNCEYCYASKPLLAETIKLLEFAEQNDLVANIGLFAPTGRAAGQKEVLFDEGFWKQLRKLYDSHRGLRGDWDTNLTLEVGCPAGYEKLHVSPYGDVTGCSLQPMSFGSLREKPLAEIVERMRGFEHFEKRAPSCIMALDEQFIEDYVDFSTDHVSTPYPVEKNPCYRADRGSAPQKRARGSWSRL